MSTVQVIELFTSIQGESSHAGRPCFFIRLAGCNLRCGYCDTTYAYAGGRDMHVADIVAQWRLSTTAIVEITGGEPLLQSGFPGLACALRDSSPRPVLVETNGSRDISVIPGHVTAIMDVKCPGSGEAAAMDMDNLARLRPYDEVKFVITDHADYIWARDIIRQYVLTSRCHAVFLSPVMPGMNPADLGDWMVEDGVDARLQVQLHKVIRVR